MPSRSRPLPVALLAAALGAALACLPAPAAAAPPPNRATVALAESAHAAYQAGDYPRAADLYFQAHQLDPADGAFLYASARSLHLAQQWALAAVRYRAFLRIETAKPEYVALAQQYLADADQQAAAEARRREQAQAEKDQRAAELAAAATAELAKLPPATVDAPPAPKPAPWSQSRRVAFFSAAGATAAAAGFLGWASWRRSAFEDAMAAGFAGGKVSGYTDPTAAQAAGHQLAMQQNLGWALATLAASAAVAAWLWPAEAR